MTIRSVAAGILLLALAGTPAGWAQAAQGAAEVHAKGDITGNWQGTLEVGKSLRAIEQFAKGEKGWTAKFYSIDQTAQPINASSVTVDGSSVKLSIDLMGVDYTGTVSADGNSMVGTFTQGGKPFPLTLVRATKETAWEIPAAPAPLKPMAADADPSLDVATIKPNDSGGTMLQGLGFRGRNFATRNSSLGDLIGFAFNVKGKQIVGAPDWLDKDRYDVSGVPDVEGTPNVEQMRTMVRKLLQDRFKLTFHMEKRELAAFVLSVGKNGQKLKPTEMSGPGPGVGFRQGKGGLTLVFANGTVGEFAMTLQTVVFDRPVVDETGLKGKFDITVTFSPDDSQFNGHPPVPAKTDGVEPAPTLFEAIQQDLGLKLEGQKTNVPVIVIDHVEKPSAN